MFKQNCKVQLLHHHEEQLVHRPGARMATLSLYQAPPQVMPVIPGRHHQNWRSSSACCRSCAFANNSIEGGCRQQTPNKALNNTYHAAKTNGCMTFLSIPLDNGISFQMLPVFLPPCHQLQETYTGRYLSAKTPKCDPMRHW